LPKEFTVRTFSNDQALVKERRNHIVRCSTEVFTKKGCGRTNVRELAKAREMSADAPYHCFGSNEETPRYAKEQTDPNLTAIDVDNKTGVGNRHRKESFK
jgi:hypothetical protein